MITATPDVAVISASAVAALVRCSTTPDPAVLSAEAVATNLRTTITPDVAVLSAAAFRPAMDVFTPRGRQAIGVDQPSGGSLYPFAVVEPSDSLADLVADFYLSYPDDGCEFVRPFSFKLLYGFGENPNGPLTLSPAVTPTHEYDVVIQDAEGRIVFNSATSGVTLQTRYWGDRLKIIEWLSDSHVCRIVMHTSWTTNETPLTYDLWIAPAAAVIDERCCEQLPKRVTKLQHLADGLRGDLKLVNGYNTTYDVVPLTTKDGGTYGFKITVNAEPGSGRGRYNGCLDVTPTITSINGIEPDEHHNFVLDAADRITQDAGCYRIERPATVVDDRAVFVPATLQLRNNCGPCCDCSDFTSVYEALRVLYNRLKNIGDRAKAARDLFGVGENSIIARYAARQSSCSGCLLRMGVVSVAGGVVSVTIEFCNNTMDEAQGGVMTIDIVASEAVGTEGLVCGSVFISGDGPEQPCDFGNSDLDGAYPNYSHTFSSVASGGKATVSFQLIYPKKDFPDPISVTINAAFLGFTASRTTATMPSLEVC